MKLKIPESSPRFIVVRDGEWHLVMDRPRLIIIARCDDYFLQLK